MVNFFKAYFNYLYLRLINDQKVTRFEMAIFFRQFSILVSAGISIVQSCDILEKSQEKPNLRNIIQQIKRELLSGKNLYTTLSIHKHFFDELTCQLVEVGEQTGKLDVMLTMIANHQEKSLFFKKRIQQALFYPCMITLIALVISFSMFIFIIPQFAELFSTTQVKLPILTLCIFYLAKVIKDNLLILLSIIFLSLLFIVYTRAKTFFYQGILKLIGKCPPFKVCLHKIILARFARNLAITFAAGIPITRSLKLSANASLDLRFRDMVAKLRSKVSTGLQLHHAMLMLSYFPTLMIQMIKIGEESGMLEQMLEKTADFYESDIDHFIARLSQLLEPLIMLILGAVIGGIVIGMYLPIFKLGSAL